jgi:hypothetical protein
VNEVEVQHFDAANDDGSGEGRAAA